MRGLPTFDDPNLLIGAEHCSDAGVYRLREDLAVAQSVDFFAPIVDDAYTFGRIAAANALGDLYAVGARPKTGLNIVCFPDDELELDVLREILRGGAERLIAAGAVVLGGHSVRDPELKFGVAATGIVDPARMFSNAGAKPGDVLVLTKALGTGFVTTANKRDRCPAETLEAACASMVALNDRASAEAVALGVRGATDITGFGLVGHALEMALASEVTIEIDLATLPLLPGAIDLATPDNHSRANRTNREHVQPSLHIEDGADETLAQFLFDPQTSGGLLLALPGAVADEGLRRLAGAGVETARAIGRVIARRDAPLVVNP